MFTRSSGVLLNISSLPSEFGIGGFSNDARNFVQSLLDMGFHWWQVLPITSLGAGNSPYSGISLRAGNYLYIDPISLMNEGLITNEELEYVKYRGEPYLVNYDHARWAKTLILRKAYERFSDWTGLNNFKTFNKSWLDDYSAFMCLKEDHNNECWYNWDNHYKFYNSKVINDYIDKNPKRFNYYCFEQYIFYKQWKAIKDMANEIGMGIIGDLPIYPCLDSVDVWSNSSEYQLDAELIPNKIAGVPPDYFASEGQLWNNPLYDYEKMKKNNYKTLKDRFNYIMNLYDVTRIDHFRGFYKYWAIPAGAATARDGQWYDGPKMDLFKDFLDKRIIAEDLGLIDEDVRDFLKETGFPGMRVMQFGFQDDDSIHLPHYYPRNCVAYSGTHDNDTTLGWLYKLDEDKRIYALHYCGHDGSGWGSGGGDCPSTKSFIKTLIRSSANLVIVTFQDLCGYGSDTRMNVPGKPDGNWEYRATYGALSKINREFLLDINKTYGRNRPFIK